MATIPLVELNSIVKRHMATTPTETPCKIEAHFNIMQSPHMIESARVAQATGEMKKALMQKN